VFSLQQRNEDGEKMTEKKKLVSEQIKITDEGVFMDPEAAWMIPALHRTKGIKFEDIVFSGPPPMPSKKLLICRHWDASCSGMQCDECGLWKERYGP